MKPQRRELHKLFHTMVTEGDLYVNDGDWDLAADMVADAIEDLTDPAQIRRAVHQKVFELAEAGMLDNPWLHDSIADTAIQALQD